MNKLNKYILSEIICIVGPFREILKLSLVCKSWHLLIIEFHHYFTLQGSHFQDIFQSSIDIIQVLLPFKSLWKLHTLDLRNIPIPEINLSEILLAQPNLHKLDLSNTQLDVSKTWRFIYEQDKVGMNLKELRLTNNRSTNLGFTELVKIYPKITKLYLANTFTSIDNLAFVFTNLQKLQILDVSLCNISSQYTIHLDFNRLLENSRLRKNFLCEMTEEMGKAFRKFNIEVITKTIAHVLVEVTDMASLSLLEDWVKMHGDVNTRCSEHHPLHNKLSIFLQFELIKQVGDQTLLYEIFKILISSGLDLMCNSMEKKSKILLISTAVSVGFSDLAGLISKMWR